MKHPIFPDYRRIAVLVNPMARGGRRYRLRRNRLEAVLRDLKIEAKWWETESHGDATRLARRIAEDRVDMLLVCGGDGTVNQVVNGWVGKETPIGILPFGTTNILAKVLGLSGGLEKAALAVLYGTPRPFRLGKANDRYFVLMAGIGLDAEVVRDVRGKVKQRWGRWAFLSATIRRAFRGDDVKLLLDVYNHDRSELSGYETIVTLVPNYAGFLRIVPEAWFKASPMWLNCFQGKGVWQGMKYFVGMFTGRHRLFKDVVVQASDAVLVRSTGPPVACQVDGEFFTTTPVRITLTEEYISLVRPQFW